MENDKNTLKDTLKKRFYENKFRYLIFPSKETPEGILVGLSKDTTDYYYIVLSSNLKLKYISTVGKVDFVDYGTEGINFNNFSVANYMAVQDLGEFLALIDNEIQKTIGIDTLLCRIK